MKKYLQFPLIVAFTLYIGLLNGQELTNSLPDYDHKVELSPMVGWALNGSINFVQGDVKFNDAMNFGAALSVNTGYTETSPNTRIK